MECRRIEINLISASDLENVREMFRMKVYAVVSIAGLQQTERRTPVDKQNETNPAWNCTIKYTVGEQALHQEGVMLVIKLYCERKLGDRYIGEVHTSIKQLYDQGQANAGGGGAILTYKVQEGSAASQGEMKLSCIFREKVIIKEEALWRRLVKKGTVILLRKAASSTLGMDLPIPFDVPFFIDPDCVVDYACQR